MEARNKNILIGGLIAIVLVMAVGYAAFATTLNITGTARIDSNWDVEITSITVGTVVSKTNSGLVTGNKENSGIENDDDTYPTYNSTGTTATFYANLVSPGDSVTYNVTVENKGNVRAQLKTIAWNSSDATTGDIRYSYDGIQQNDILAAVDANSTDDTIQFTVTVTYYNDTENDQSDATQKTKQATLILDFEQAPSA